jgi:hypothetical protein
MTNTEEILQIINRTTLDNPLPYFFSWLKSQPNYNLERFIFESVEYFYLEGFKQFTNLEWGRKIKIDYRDKAATAPFGKLIQSIYNLCKECHALQDVSKIRVNHNNAYRWFAVCIFEMIYLDFTLLTTREKSNYFEIWEERLNGLQKGDYPSDFEVCVRNPPNKNSKNLDTKYNLFKHEKCLNLTLLIESAFSLKEVNPSFKKNYWEPFITAQKSIIKLKTNKYLQDVRLLPQTEEYQTKLPGRGRYKKSK